MGKEKVWRNINLNVNKFYLSRSEAILAVMRQRDGFKDLPHLSRSFVLRLAIEKGLNGLEQELEIIKEQQ